MACWGGDVGAGPVEVFGASPVIVGNCIEGNTSGRFSHGGGISLFIGVFTVVMNNVIRHNEAPNGFGGRISAIAVAMGPIA